jgi:hypothetical protein
LYKSLSLNDVDQGRAGFDASAGFDAAKKKALEAVKAKLPMESGNKSQV